MIPDLGKYTTEVLSAYGVSIVLILLLVVISLRQSKRARIALEEAEKRLKK